MASYVIKCPFCGGEMTVQSEWAGQTMACAHCRRAFVVQPESAPAPLPVNGFAVPGNAVVEPVRPAGVTANFLRKLYRGWWLYLAIGFVSMFVIGIFAAIWSVSRFSQSGDITASDVASSVAVIILSVWLVFSVFIILSVISFYRLVYNLWKLVPPGIAEATPGTAVGFLFIPFFNLYWIFVAYGGLARAYNRMSGGQHSDLDSFVRMANIFQILIFIPWIGGIFGILSFIFQLIYMRRFIHIASGWLPEE